MKFLIKLNWGLFEKPPNVSKIFSPIGKASKSIPKGDLCKVLHLAETGHTCFSIRTAEMKGIHDKKSRKLEI